MRIAHVTDLHVLDLEGVHPTDFLSQRVLGGLNLLINRRGEYPVEVAEALMVDINAQAIDHVVVSGDLTNLSLSSEFERARRVLSLLSLPSAEITAVPGNHDCYTLGERIRGNFRRVLGAFSEGDPLDETPSGRRGEMPAAPARRGGTRAPSFPFVRLRGPLAVVALSTAHVSAPLLATGSLGRRQLEAAEVLLRRPEVRERFRLVVMHHPPRSPYARWHKRLVDGEDFIAMIARVGADLIVHGHLHRDLRDELPGPERPAQVIGLNSSTWKAEDPQRRAAYNIYQVDDEGRLGLVERRHYDFDTASWGATAAAAL